jgi:hypothetical protein
MPRARSCPTRTLRCLQLTAASRATLPLRRSPTAMLRRRTRALQLRLRTPQCPSCVDTIAAKPTRAARWSTARRCVVAIPATKTQIKTATVSRIAAPTVAARTVRVRSAPGGLLVIARPVGRATVVKRRTAPAWIVRAMVAAKRPQAWPRAAVSSVGPARTVSKRIAAGSAAPDTAAAIPTVARRTARATRVGRARIARKQTAQPSAATVTAAAILAAASRTACVLRVGAVARARSRTATV